MRVTCPLCQKEHNVRADKMKHKYYTGKCIEC